MTTIVLDNEAVQALTNPAHPKRTHVLAHVDAVATDRRRGLRKSMVVPATVRVEAGWDRSDPRSAVANRLTINDHFLDHTSANRAAQIVRRTGLTPADAHVAVVALTAPDDVVALTSDTPDITRATDGQVRIVRV
ncbi:MAG: hypothetical protein FWF21_10840 [Micrococcales bacterium]|nr:hypothetical protein [Micrococcales bacterium]